MGFTSWRWSIGAVLWGFASFASAQTAGPTCDQLIPDLSTAQACTITVNSAGDDARAANAARGSCGATCTLRAAIQTAMDPRLSPAPAEGGPPAQPLSVTIQIAASVPVIRVTTALPEITNSIPAQPASGSMPAQPERVGRLQAVTIVGQGANPVQVQRNGLLPAGATELGCASPLVGTPAAFRLLDVRSPGSTFPALPPARLDLNLQNVTLCNGAAAGAGGGIRFTPGSSSNLTLDRVRVLNNRAIAPDAVGGGVYVDGAQHVVNIVETSLSGNIAEGADGRGGGLALLGSRATIERSTIGPHVATFNTVVGGNVANLGAAIFLGRNAALIHGAVDLRNSFISGNRTNNPLDPDLGTSGIHSVAAANSSSINSTFARNRGGLLFRAETGFVSGIFPGTALRPFVGNLIAENQGGLCTSLVGATTAVDSGYNFCQEGPAPDFRSCCGVFVDMFNAIPQAGVLLPAEAANANAAAEGHVSRGNRPSVLPLVDSAGGFDSSGTARTPVDHVASNRALATDARGGAAVALRPNGLGTRDVGAYELAAFGGVRFDPPSAEGFVAFEPAQGATAQANLSFARGGAGSVNLNQLRVRSVEGNIPTLTAPQLVQGTATPDSGSVLGDYAPLALRTVEIAANLQTVSVPLVVRGDAVVENAETVNLVLLAAPNRFAGAAGTDAQDVLLSDPDRNPPDVERQTVRYCANPDRTGTAGDNRPEFTPCVVERLTIVEPPTVRFDVAQQQFTFTLDEGGEFTFSVVRQGATDQPASVRCVSMDGEAVAGADFDPVDQLLTWPAGDTSARSCTVRALVDQVNEPEETFKLALTNANGATVGEPAELTLVIPQNSAPLAPAVGFAAATQAVSEGAGGMTVEVRRLPNNAGAISVTIASENGTAIAGTHYAAVNEVLSWTSNDFTSRFVPVSIIDNAAVNENRTFRLRLTNPTGGRIQSPDLLTVTILDDDDDNAPRAIQVTGVTQPIREGASASIGVRLSRAPSAPVTVNLLPDLGLSVSPSTLTFNLENFGQPQAVEITAVDNQTVDGTRSLRTRLLAQSQDASYNGIETTTTVQVLDNDSQLRFQNDEQSRLVNESAGTISVVVERFGALLGSAQVQIATVDGTATSGADYTAVSQVLSWADGEGGARTVQVGIVDDSVPEVEEQFEVVLSSPQGGAGGNLLLPSNPRLTIRIADDDTPGIAANPATISIAEGQSGTSQIRLNTLPTANVTVTLQSADPAVAVQPSTLSFTPANFAQAQPVTVTVADDNNAQGNRAVNIALTSSSADPGYAGRTGSLLVTVLDNDTAGLSITPSSLALIKDNPQGYSIRLTAEPLAPVTVTLSGQGLTFSPSTLQFTASNYTNPRNVTVFASTLPGPGQTVSRTLQHTAASSDAAFNGLTVNLPVTVTNSDQAPSVNVTASSSPLALVAGEPGVRQVLTLTLGGGALAGNVTVTPSANGNLTFSPAQVTFVPGGPQQQAIFVDARDVPAAGGNFVITYGVTGGAQVTPQSTPVSVASANQTSGGGGGALPLLSLLALLFAGAIRSRRFRR